MGLQLPDHRFKSDWRLQFVLKSSINDMAVVAKWLTHRIVAPTFGGSIPLGRPIIVYRLVLSVESPVVWAFLFIFRR